MKDEPFFDIVCVTVQCAPMTEVWSTCYHQVVIYNYIEMVYLHDCPPVNHELH